MAATDTDQAGGATAVAERSVPRLKQRYQSEIHAAMLEEFKYPNVMQVPTLTRSWSTWASARRPGTPS